MRIKTTRFKSNNPKKAEGNWYIYKEQWLFRDEVKKKFLDFATSFDALWF